MVDQTTFKSARQFAEKAVADIQDRELRTAAFTVLLGHLLATGNAALAVAPAALRERKERTTPSKTTTAKGKAAAASSTKSRLLALREKEFFKMQRSLGEVREELRRHGWHYPLTALSGPMQDLVRERFLRRERLSEGGGKRKVWRYSDF
ncbi:MAG TPA: hypothetical protein VKG86_01175 [Terracidiphilus sp.]|nr:hypothetical protein [Terracidiphilus sp.]